MRAATDRIELLGDTLTPTLATPGAPGLLATKATHGCQVRILIADPRPHLAPLLDQPGIEIRVLEAPPPHTIHRYDDQLLLTLHLPGVPADQAPLLHLQRAAPGGLFERFADYYDELWEQASQPIDPELDLAPDEDNNENENLEPDRALPAARQPAARPGEPSTPPPRRWPRRPS
jgi:hypothetical protein